MKNVIFLTAFLIPFCATGQFNFSGYATQQAGIEHNPLNNPSSFVFDISEGEGEVMELAPTTFIARSKIYIHARQKRENISFGFRPKLTYDYFPLLPDANHLKGSLEQYFYFEINKKWKFYERFSVTTNQRNGDALDEDVFSIPRSYERWQGGVGTVFKFDRKWSLDIGSYYLKNKFFAEDEMNYYQAMIVEGKLKRKFKKSKLIRKMEFSLKGQQRNWFRGSEDEEEDWVESVTSMQYWQMRWSADFVLNDNWTLEPFVKIAGRNSERKTQNWSSLQVGFSSAWFMDNVSLRWASSLSGRVHPDLKPANNETLKYVYFRNKITVECRLKGNWSAMLDSQHTQRLSNLKDRSSIAFRSYKNVYAGLGLKVRF